MLKTISTTIAAAFLAVGIAQPASAGLSFNGLGLNGLGLNGLVLNGLQLNARVLQGTADSHTAATLIAIELPAQAGQ